MVFAPRSAGDQLATLFVDSTPDGGQAVAVLDGEGTWPPTPTATFAPNPVEFGAVPVGETETVFVTVENTGGSTLAFGDVIAATGDMDVFTVDGDTCGSRLPAGGTCTAEFVFAPTTAGSKAASITVSANLAGGSFSIDMLGYAYDEPLAETTVSVLPNPVDFGIVTVGTTKHVSVTATNTGPSVLVFAGPSSSTGDVNRFLVDGGTCGDYLLPGATCTADFWFTPTTAGPTSGALEFPWNVPGGSIAIAMTGTGAMPDGPATGTGTPLPSTPPQGTAAATSSASGSPLSAPPPDEPAAAPERLRVRWVGSGRHVVRVSRAEFPLVLRYELSDRASVLLTVSRRTHRVFSARRWSVGAGTHPVALRKKLLRRLAPGRYVVTVRATRGSERSTAPMTLVVR